MRTEFLLVILFSIFVWKIEALEIFNKIRFTDLEKHIFVRMKYVNKILDNRSGGHSLEELKGISLN